MPNWKWTIGVFDEWHSEHSHIKRQFCQHRLLDDQSMYIHPCSAASAWVLYCSSAVDFYAINRRINRPAIGVPVSSQFFTGCCSHQLQHYVLAAISQRRLTHSAISTCQPGRGQNEAFFLLIDQSLFGLAGLSCG